MTTTSETTNPALQLLPDFAHFEACFDRWMANNPGFQARQLTANRQRNLFLKSYLACYPGGKTS